MKYIIGIDEVGRGSFAGPVVVAALCLPPRTRFPKYLGALKDSKQLTATAREAWFGYFHHHPNIQYAIAKVHPATIDRINISRAANLAALRAYARLEKLGKLKKKAEARSIKKKDQIFLDGSLYIKNKIISAAYGAKTIIKADKKIPAVAAASIIAKVIRDRLMARMAKRHPGYGFEVHKGYGTVLHQRRLKKLGPSPIHRLTFLG